MSEENRKTRKANKIVPMPTAMDDQENDQVDSLILERLDREADALEEELNNDPSLAGVSLSSDFLNVIVGKLKEEGLWEEEDEEAAAEKTDGGGENGDNRERDEETESEGGKASEEGKESEAEKESEAGKESEEGKGSEAEKESEERKASGEEKESEEGTAAENQNDREGVVAMTQEELDRLYQMLPEQDRRAMEMGRQVEKKQEKRRRRIRRWGMPVGVAASLMVLVCGVGMSSEANREWLLQTGAVILRNLGFNISAEFTDRENIIYSKSVAEQEAIKNIKEKMNILAPCFVEVLNGFEFLNCEITPDENEATMFYSYQDRIITVKTFRVGDEGVTYTGFDDQAVLEDTLENLQGANIKIWEINLDIQQESYLAEIEYMEGRYVINAAMPLDEIKKLVKSVIFL